MTYRRTGPIEKAVRRDLRGYPKDIADGAIARSMLTLADRADNTVLEPRDLAQILRELRLCATQLRDMAPGEVKGDSIDQLRERRERRLAGGQ